MTRLLTILFFFLLISSCKTVHIKQDQQKLTNYPVTIGSIGEDRNFVIQKDYKTTAYPGYKKQIKIETQVVPFNKATFSAFQKARALQNAKVTIAYVDSLSIKPAFLNIRLSDRVAVINNMITVVNQDTFEYIKNKEKAHIVTSISVALEAKTILEIQNADEVFLSTYGVKNYVLKLYTNKKVVKTINFNDGVIFSYKTSNFCWKQDDKYRVQIIDIVESNKSCPKKSYRSAKRANKKINYYKF